MKKNKYLIQYMLFSNWNVMVKLQTIMNNDIFVTVNFYSSINLFLLHCTLICFFFPAWACVVKFAKNGVNFNLYQNIAQVIFCNFL